MTLSDPPLAHIPAGRVSVPARVAAITGGRPLEAVWVNGLGGLTFRDHLAPGGPAFVKWVAAGTPELSLSGEAERLAWARARGALVPEVLSHGCDATGAWLVTRALGGGPDAGSHGGESASDAVAESAVAPRWIARPADAARAIGVGLRALHDTLPADDCPFDWGVATRLSMVDARIAEELAAGVGDGSAVAGRGKVGIGNPLGGTPSAWTAPYLGMPGRELRAMLADAPPIDAVVCHGDACAPNTLLDASGGFAGHVDLGELGVADRWADLAVAAWSTEWNYGQGFDHLVYEGYGVEPDAERIRYYRLLWDAS